MLDPAKAKCPHCYARGTLIQASYMYGGVEYDDWYCGICGKNWFKGSRVKQEQQPAGSVQ